MKQTCILILGMHRSGTSALTGVLSLLDVYLGSELMPATEDNKKGYFENNNLYRINEKLLAQIGSSWEDIFFVEDKLKDLVEIEELKEQLKKEFEYSKIFAIKDPRLAFLFPVYKKVLKELGIKIKIIIPYRNPVEVASSLNKRDGFIFENAMLLWAYHILLAEKFSRNYKRVFIGFDELMSEPKNTIKLISEKLDIQLNSKYQKKRKKIKEFLEPGLKHHNISIDNLSNNIPKIVQDILSFRNTYNENNILKIFDSLRIELFDYQKLFYNQSIVKTFSNLKQTKQAINEKDNLLSLSKLALEETRTGLSQSTQTVEKKQQELAQTRKDLNEKECLLAQSKLTLEETRTSLSQSTQTIEKQQQELTQIQQALNEKESLLAQSKLALEETKTGLSQSTQTIEKQQQELAQTQQALNEKESLLAQRKLALEETKTGLSQSTQTIEKQQQELTQTQQALNEKESLLAQSKLALEETKTGLIQTVEKQQQALRQTQQALQEKEKLLQKKNKELEDYKNQIEQLKDELVVIYTGRGHGIIRFIKKLKGHF